VTYARNPRLEVAIQQQQGRAKAIITASLLKIWVSVIASDNFVKDFVRSD
jgi:hypothetical protein